MVVRLKGGVPRWMALSAGPAALALCLGLGAATTASAETGAEGAPAAAVLFTLDYKLDVLGVADGGLARGGRHLDSLSLAAEVDLDRAVGWTGGSIHLEALNTGGEAPGELSGSIQGVDNIEVSARRPRLYQAWVEQAFAGDRANLRLGFSDLSGEFATAESSGLLLNPSFGMAPEFAASGAAAFPSTAMGARLRLHPTASTYLQVATANARAGVPGDAGGADFSFDDGEILLAEAGWTGRGKVALGYWRLSDKQDDLLDVDLAGDLVARTMEGAYLVVEQPLSHGGEAERSTTAFLRAGASEGRTTLVSGSLQAGLLVEPALAARPDSSLSVGVTRARLSPAYRAAALAGGLDLTRDEMVLEATYSDLVTPNLRIQPDVQYIRRPAGDRAVRNALVLGVRFNLGF